MPKHRRYGGLVFLTALILIVLLTLVATAISGRGSGDRDGPGWAGDVRRLTSELERLHPNLYFQVSREEFHRAAEAIIVSLPGMDDSEVKVALARLVAMVGDAHTSIPLGDSSVGFGTFPIEARWFPEGLYIIWAADWDLIGHRIIRVGESDIDSVAVLVADLISHENDQWVMSLSPDYILTPEVLRALGVVPDAERATFTLRENGGRLFEVSLEAVEREALTGRQARRDGRIPFIYGPPYGPLYLFHEGTHFWFRYLEDEETIYIKYDSCRGDLTPIVAEISRVLDTRPVRSLVVDLRHNGGGNSAVIHPLLAELSRRPSLKGHIYCAIGPATMSSAVMNAVHLKRQLGAVLVGEPTGGKPNSYGNVRMLTLPHSGLRVFHSTRYFKIRPEDTPSLEPDIYVELTATDYFSGRDPVLETILRLETDAAEAPTG